MELLPLELEDTYPSLNDMNQAINFFASSQGYAVVKRRTKTSKKGVLRKAVLMCDCSKEHVIEN